MGINAHPAGRKNEMAIFEYTRHDGVATLNLKNPPENRLSRELMTAFGEAVADLAGRKDVRAILLKSEGPDYCFGGDYTKWEGMTGPMATELVGRGLELANALQDLPGPIVTAGQGHCRGGGFEFALRADYIIAADDAKCGYPAATIGIF